VPCLAVWRAPSHVCMQSCLRATVPA
jgi:hypothetical protein